MDQKNVEDYVNAVSDLTDRLQSDIIKGNIINTETIVALSRLHSAAEKMKTLIDFIARKRILNEQ